MGLISKLLGRGKKSKKPLAAGEPPVLCDKHRKALLEDFRDKHHGRLVKAVASQLVDEYEARGHEAMLFKEIHRTDNGCSVCFAGVVILNRARKQVRLTPEAAPAGPLLV